MSIPGARFGDFACLGSVGSLGYGATRSGAATPAVTLSGSSPEGHAVGDVASAHAKAVNARSGTLNG
ncbi:MAG TPA: hypothetical protein VKY62_10995 [Devosia sp.]|nr:hypothetical protein [Devosia sp.]